MSFVDVFLTKVFFIFLLAASLQGHNHSWSTFSIDEEKCPTERRYIDYHSQYAQQGRLAVVEVTEPLEASVALVLQVAKVAVRWHLALVLNVHSLSQFTQYLEPNAFDWQLSLNVTPSLSLVVHNPSSMLLRVGPQGATELHFLSLAAATEALAQLENGTVVAVDDRCFFHLMFRKTLYLGRLLWETTRRLQLSPTQPYTAWHAFFEHRGFVYGSPAHIVPQDVNVLAVCQSYEQAVGPSEHTLVLTSNYYQFKWTCGQRTERPHFVDFGLDGPRTAVALDGFFLDFLLLLNAESVTHGNTVLGNLVANVTKMHCNRSHRSPSLFHCFSVNRTLLSPNLPPPAPPPPWESVITELSRPATFVANGTRFAPSPRQQSFRYVQQLLHDWQHPPPRQCEHARFLLYEPVVAGIGSMAHTSAAALGVAIAAGRVLLLRPHRYRSPWTTGTDCLPQASWLECFFQPVTSCAVAVPRRDPPLVKEKMDLAKAPARFLRANAIGKPRADRPIGPGGYCVLQRGMKGPHGPIYNRLRQHLSGTRVAPTGHLLRFLLRPRPFFSARIRDFLDSQRGLHEWLQPPLPFMAVHLRYGDKGYEAKPKALAAYASVLQQNDVQRAFVSTETEAVLYQFPSFLQNCSMFNLTYKRKGKDLLGANPAAELVASFANLLISLQAAAFLGTRSSNWCRMTEELAVASGHPERPYHSLDQGQWPICFPP